MYISKISLKNIRGFESLDFDLDRGDGQFAGWTVFTGSNGSGKSTLLKAIGFCLVPPDARITLSNPVYFPSRTPLGPDCGIDLRFLRSETDDELPSAEGWPYPDYHEGISFRGLIGWNEGGIFTWTEHSADRPLKGWFSCGYGPFRRITSPKENVEQVQRSKDSERFATLFFEAATLSEIDPWLTTLKFQQLEGSEVAAGQLTFFLDLIGDSLLPDGFSVDRVDSKGLWLKNSDGVELSWFDMSDGHRVAIILVADIVRHMIAAYGLEALYDRDAEGKLFIKRSGVVLIDEIDAHLHPEWQREIGFWLKDHFPKVQFLVTTHSPIILQAADPNGLFVLPEPGSGEKPRPLTQEEYQKIIASRPDSILLSPAFGMENTRSEPVVEKRARYSHLQAKKRAGGKLSAVEADECMNLLPFVSVDGEA